MSTDAIPVTADPAEASLSDRDRIVLAACRQLGAEGRRMSRDNVRGLIGGGGSFVMDVICRLRQLRLIPDARPGNPGPERRSRPPAPVPGPDGLTDLERACLDACAALAPGRARLTQALVRDRVARRGPDVGVALRRLVALGRLDADTLLPLSPRAPLAVPLARGEAIDPDTMRRPRPAPRDGPCHEAVADYHRAWGRIRTLLPGKGVTP